MPRRSGPVSLPAWQDRWSALRDVQEHSIDGSDLSRPLEAAFEDYQHGYGNGEFTWAGVWGVTSSPPEIRDPLITASEMDRGRISRWRLPVRDDVPVLEIDSPRDWFRLVETFPRSPRGPTALTRKTTPYRRLRTHPIDGLTERCWAQYSRRGDRRGSGESGL